MTSLTPESSAIDATAGTVSHDGYGIAVQIGRSTAADGSQAYSCTVTATPRGDDRGQRGFERTLVLTETEAIVSNMLRPGTLPPLDQLQAGLASIATRYVQMLIDVANRGFDGLAPSATRSVSEVWSRIGMTDRALQMRER